MPPQTANKQFEFTGNASSFFVMYLVVALLSFIPLVGFAFAFNYQNKWLATNIKVQNRQLTYQATLGEVWVMLVVGLLLTMVTFGIYIFWFVPKVYRFVLDHVHFADEIPAAPVTTALPTTPAQPVANPPVAPTPPTNTVPPSSNLVQ